MTSPIERRSSTVAAIPTSGHPDTPRFPFSTPGQQELAGRIGVADAWS
ncbi:MAG: hypothetical protein PHP55_12295 [Methanoculleus sp.]|nr:hypothetical protein [Methanoculleus sp.]